VQHYEEDEQAHEEEEVQAHKEEEEVGIDAEADDDTTEAPVVRPLCPTSVSACII
jgi:hypothetical protein